MLETAVTDRAEELRLQQEVAEAGRVDADITALLVDVSAGSELALLSVRVRGRGGGLVGVELLIGVVDEIFFGRHFGGGDLVWLEMGVEDEK